MSDGGAGAERQASLNLSPLVSGILSDAHVTGSGVAGADGGDGEAMAKAPEEPSHLPGASLSAPAVTSDGAGAGAGSGGSGAAVKASARVSLLPAVPADITAAVDRIETVPSVGAGSPTRQRSPMAGGTAAAAGGSGAAADMKSPLSARFGSGTGSIRGGTGSVRRPTTAGPQRDMAALTASIKKHNHANMFDGVEDGATAGTAAASSSPPHAPGAVGGSARSSASGIALVASPTSSAPPSAPGTGNGSSTVASSLVSASSSSSSSGSSAAAPGGPARLASPTAAGGGGRSSLSPGGSAGTSNASAPLPTTYQAPVSPPGATLPTTTRSGYGSAPPQPATGGQDVVSPLGGFHHQRGGSLGGSVAGSGATGGGFIGSPIDRRPGSTTHAGGSSGSGAHPLLKSPPPGSSHSGSGGAHHLSSPPPQMGGGARGSVFGGTDLGLSSTITRIIGGNAHNPGLGAAAGGAGVGSAQNTPLLPHRRPLDGVMPDAEPSPGPASGRLGRRPPQPIDTDLLSSPAPPIAGGSAGAGIGPAPGSARKPTHLPALTMSGRHRPSSSQGGDGGGDMFIAKRDASPPRTPNDAGAGAGGPPRTAPRTSLSPMHANSNALDAPGGTPGGGNNVMLRSARSKEHNPDLQNPLTLTTRPMTGTRVGTAGSAGGAVDAPLPNLVLPENADKLVEQFPFFWLMWVIVLIGLAIAGDVWTATQVDVPALGSDAPYDTKLAWVLHGLFLAGMALTLVFLCIWKSPYHSGVALTWQFALSLQFVSAAMITTQQGLWDRDLVIPYSDAPHFAMQFWWLLIVIFYVGFTIFTYNAPHHIPPISADTLEKGLLVKQLRETRGALQSTRGILESVRPGLLGAQTPGGGAGGSMFPDTADGPGAGASGGMSGGVDGATGTRRNRRHTSQGYGNNYPQHRRPGSSSAEHNAAMMAGVTASRRIRERDRSATHPQKGADALVAHLSVDITPAKPSDAGASN